MPNLFDVARHFDDIPVVDGYSAAPLFKAQFSTFNESSPDGSVLLKRVLSVRPGTTIPTRRVIRVLGEYWIVGHGNHDGIYGKPIRETFWMKKVSDTVEIISPAQACNGGSGTFMMASVNYLKDTVNGVSDTQYDPFWDVYVGISESASKGQYVRSGSKLYRIRGTHQELSGFTLMQCDELDQGSQVTATVQSGLSYDPINDTYSGTPTNLAGLLLESSKFYKYDTLADPKYNAGDMNFVTTTKQPINAVLSISSVKWRVMAVQQELDAWNHHVRVV